MSAAAALTLLGCGGSTHATTHSPRAQVVDLGKTPVRKGAPPPEQARPRHTAKARRRAPVSRPRIVRRLIPFDEKRKRETAAYSKRHYGMDGFELRRPRVIVEHWTETSSFDDAYKLFAPDAPDQELHELPGLCAHFIVDRDGTIYQLVPLSLMCRHTVGLNYTAIGIEHVGYTDQQILGDKAQLEASIALTRWLTCRYGVAIRDVIGHNESLSSPYHRELVASLRNQTHPDMAAASMRRYRAMLARESC